MKPTALFSPTLSATPAEITVVAASGSKLVFESQLPYNPERIRAAAIYCSDGRFGDHCDDFLHNCLRLPRCDRLVIPGGPGNLAGHFLTYRESEALAQQLEFLAEAHKLERVVLIAHEGCAYYSHRLHIPAAEATQRQFADLRKAAERIKGMSSRLEVQAHMAWRREHHIVFEAVPLAPQAPQSAGLGG